MAIADEKECIRFFGDAYKAYMKQTKRFIPFILWKKVVSDKFKETKNPLFLPVRVFLYLFYIL